MTIRDFFYVDWKDKWNIILLIIAILLLWWGVKGILSALKAGLP